MAHGACNMKLLLAKKLVEECFRMAKVLNFKQELTGCFGKPISENPTQAMVEAAYRHHDLDWRYITMEVGAEDLADAVRGMRAVGFRGFNCTIPHKVDVIQHLDGLGESASVMGAVNCVVRRGDELIGENTDGKGFVTGLRELMDPAGTKVVMFGAGGAARAIGVEMALAGAAKITVVNRSKDRGETLHKLLDEKVPAEAELVSWDETYSIPEDADVVINATSIGLFPDVDARLNFDVETLQPNMVVADVIPNPPLTNLVKDARARGCRVIDGLGMLVNQGVIGIKYWTGVDVDPGVMRQALEDVFSE
jgi:shikimate dehydrogenase